MASNIDLIFSELIALMTLNHNNVVTISFSVCVYLRRFLLKRSFSHQLSINEQRASV